MATKKAKRNNANKTSQTAKTTTKPRIVKSTKIATSRSASANNGPANLIASAPFGAMFAEFIGTFFLTALIISTSGQPIFIFFALITISLVIGHLSGAHVNPAITFGAWISRKMSTVNAVWYIIAQVLGGMLALVILNYMLGGLAGQVDPSTGKEVAPKLFTAAQVMSGKEWFAFFGGVLGMGVFAFAFASALREKKEHIAAAFTVGGGLFLGLIIAGTSGFVAGSTGAGATLNPAAALGLQAFSNLKADGALTWALAVHVAAPLIGAAIGFFLYDLFRRDVDTSA